MFGVAQVLQVVPELQELVLLEPLELVEQLVLVGCMELEELVSVGLECLFPLPLYSYAISLQLPVSPDSYLERLQESVGLELLAPQHQLSLLYSLALLELLALLAELKLLALQVVLQL